MGLSMTMRVFIADDHPVVLGGLRSLVDQHPEFSVIGTATDGQQALDEIVKLQPELAIVDLNMPSANGLTVLQSIRQHGLSTRVVVLAASATEHEIYGIVSAGADGLLFKDAAPTTLHQCLSTIARGGNWIPEEAVAVAAREGQHLSEKRAELSLLTPRERDLVRLVAIGRTNKDIAHELELTEGTVKVHLNNIFRKLKLSSRTDLQDFDLENAAR
jgi:DNA-binding NarL/FixJ family response regulator